MEQEGSKESPIEIPVSNMNHTYKRMKVIKFTKLKKEVIVFYEMTPEDGGHYAEWIIAEKKGEKYDCSYFLDPIEVTKELKKKHKIKNSSYKELFRT